MLSRWFLAARGHPSPLKPHRVPICMKTVITAKSSCCPHHEMRKQPKLKRKMFKNTFKCTLGHPVDLSACWGSKQAVEHHQHQRYQQQHGDRASEPRSTVTTRKLEKSTWRERGLQRSSMATWSAGPLGSICLLKVPVVSLLLCLWAPFHTVVQGICLQVYLGEQ